MEIHIKVIEHSEQRYPTCGDWWFDDNGNLEIRVSELSNWRHEVLIAVHELCEVLICKHRKITTEEVDEFDKSFEKLRENFPEVIGDMEPGNMTSAPYYKEHQTATHIERIMATELDVDWKKYDNEVNNL